MLPQNDRQFLLPSVKVYIFTFFFTIFFFCEGLKFKKPLEIFHISSILNGVKHYADFLQNVDTDKIYEINTVVIDHS